MPLSILTRMTDESLITGRCCYSMLNAQQELTPFFVSATGALADSNA